ncbi:Putative FAD-binding domain, FAD/NAD(P)-binding domain superfamily [Septoria linicola]|uniref:FAD-binding domain, FAD/NAD(P)-binding domain superfamily n=1 Tax=Septoria linicola TaxID=215465 RepID=A0A9Q9AQ44_9PEZI|nr:putative FAD-binding domain, FAD/NAD(P)-binding domain superfamily [Septoria linicola]USW50515.1 Putative FAD-binding domain, FAD/NAD(P)-binding domain superfamily [Septoria linicola]
MKVIIVGGGIAGLTLANALEQADIDFVLLEARSLLDPQVGASIGLGAQSLRIYDQFGAAQDILDETVPLTISRGHRADGSPIGKAQPVFQLLEPRLGYGISFLDRQLVLRAAADSIGQKHKLILNKRMKGIDHSDTSVTVHCDDGTSYKGDIVIGCDGVNSRVRQEMWRLADKEEPGYFPETEKTKMTAEYRCLFGISQPTPGLDVEGAADLTYDKGQSFLVITGKDRRVFWFYFEKLDKAYKYSDPDFPRYTKPDAEGLAAKNSHRKCHTTVTLGDLWENRVSYTLVPMEEALFSRWHWNRIATIGDCAHKMTANHGQAGNNAIESAAALANQLYILNQTSLSSSQLPSTLDFNTAFTNWQGKRQARIEHTVKEAALVCRYSVLDSYMAYIFHFVLVPNLPSLYINMQTANMIGAELLEWLPVPPRSLKGTMAFNQLQGIGRGESTLRRALRASPLLALTWFVWTKTRETTQTDFCEYTMDVLSPAGRDPEATLRILGFGICELMLYALRGLESGRRANGLNVFLRFPIMFAVAAQVYGVAVVMPFYFFIHYISGGVDVFAAADMRLMNLAYIRTLLPSLLLLLGGALTSVMLRPSMAIDNDTLKILRLFPPIGIALAQKFLHRFNKDTEEHDMIHNCTADLFTIRRTVYSFIGIACLAMALQYQHFSSTRIFDFHFPSERDTLDWNNLSLIHAGLFWLTLHFYDLHRAGMASLPKIIAFGFLFASSHLATPLPLRPLVDMSFVLLGWLAREEILATKKEKHAITKEKYGGGNSVMEVEGKKGRDVVGEKVARMEHGNVKEANGVPKVKGVELTSAVPLF